MRTLSYKLSKKNGTLNTEEKKQNNETNSSNLITPVKNKALYLNTDESRYTIGKIVKLNSDNKSIDDIMNIYNASKNISICTYTCDCKNKKNKCYKLNFSHANYDCSNEFRHSKSSLDKAPELNISKCFSKSSKKTTGPTNQKSIMINKFLSIKEQENILTQGSCESPDKIKYSKSSVDKSAESHKTPKETKPVNQKSTTINKFLNSTKVKEKEIFLPQKASDGFKKIKINVYVNNKHKKNSKSVK